MIKNIIWRVAAEDRQGMLLEVQSNLQPSFQKFQLNNKWTFLHSNEPNYTSKCTKND